LIVLVLGCQQQLSIPHPFRHCLVAGLPGDCLQTFATVHVEAQPNALQRNVIARAELFTMDLPTIGLVLQSMMHMDRMKFIGKLRAELGEKME
jgi:hypothetical protein